MLRASRWASIYEMSRTLSVGVEDMNVGASRRSTVESIACDLCKRRSLCSETWSPNAIFQYSVLCMTRLPVFVVRMRLVMLDTHRTFQRPRS